MKKILIILATLVAMTAAVTVITGGAGASGGAMSARAAAATRSGKSAINRNLEVFSALYKELQTFYVDTIDADKSMNTAIEAMLDEIDPYTEYISSEKQEAYERNITGEYAGIGSLIMKRDSFVVISEPLAASPAFNAGLRAGDRLLMIDTMSVVGWPVDKVSAALRGNAGTKLTVKVLRPYVQDSILTFAITRRKIQEQAVPFYGPVRGDIGYIHLTGFTDKAAGDVKEALLELKKNPQVKCIVLDLRGNGGGLLDAAVKILGYFLPKGTEVLRTRGRDKLSEKVYKTATQPIDPDIPLFVLTDGSTASSSEIVAGALQDLDRAVIVGTRSFGKGLVQTSRPLPYDGLLKVTIAKYFIPSGRLIQAIDYSRRNPDGSVSRIPDSLTNVFFTAGRRPVRDGGGITPDVTVDYAQPSRLTINIMERQKLSDFATRYAATHPTLPAPAEFVITDSIYEDFRTFAEADSVVHDRVLEKVIASLRDVVGKEGYLSDSVDAQITTLGRMLRLDPDKEFARSRPELERYLTPEISGRYYLRAGEIESALRYDEALDTVSAILAAPGRYRAILAPVKNAKQPKPSKQPKNAKK